MGEQEEVAQAIAYAEKWDIQLTFEDALTNLLVAHPDDAMGFLYDQIVQKSAPPVIEKVSGREVLDSCGIPTVEVEVWGQVHGKSEFLASSCAPSCDFCPIEDAYVLVDTASPRFGGRGARQSVSAVTSVYQPVLESKQFFDQKELDTSIQTADGTPNRRKTGSNTMIATSASLAIAAAKVLRLPLFQHIANCLSKRNKFYMPRPIFALFDVPRGPISRVYLLPSSTLPIEEQIRVIGEIYLHFSQSMKTSIAADGTFPLHTEKLDDILQSAEIAVSGGGHTLGDDVFLGFLGTPEATPQFWKELFESNSYIAYVEDPIKPDDAPGIVEVTKAAPEDLVVAVGRGVNSKPERISNVMPGKAVVLRPPQAGTISACVAVADQIEKATKRCVVATSLRETSDSWIVDLAVAVGAPLIQLGAPAKGENVAKLNRLLEVSKEVEALNTEKEE